MKQLSIHQHASSVFPRRPGLKITNSGSRTSRCCSRCFLRFSSQTGGSSTYLRIHTTASAGSTPTHSMPRQPMVSLNSAKIRADRAKPMPQEPCSTPLMKPRERMRPGFHRQGGSQRAPAPPMPRAARKRKRNLKVGEKPAIKLQIGSQRIEIISGVFRPTRSASQPDAVAPPPIASTGLR